MQYSLVKGEIYSFTAPVGLRVECADGEIWLTIEGNYEDILLEPGAIFTCNRSARLVLQALETSTFLFPSLSALACKPHLLERQESPFQTPPARRSDMLTLGAWG